MKLTLLDPFTGVDALGRTWQWYCYTYRPAIVDRCAGVSIPGEAGDFWRLVNANRGVA